MNIITLSIFHLIRRLYHELPLFFACDDNDLLLRLLAYHRWPEQKKRPILPSWVTQANIKKTKAIRHQLTQAFDDDGIIFVNPMLTEEKGRVDEKYP